MELLTLQPQKNPWAQRWACIHLFFYYFKLALSLRTFFPLDPKFDLPQFSTLGSLAILRPFSADGCCPSSLCWQAASRVIDVWQIPISLQWWNDDIRHRTNFSIKTGLPDATFSPHFRNLIHAQTQKHNHTSAKLLLFSVFGHPATPAVLLARLAKHG
jgi:hypothetical protein